MFGPRYKSRFLENLLGSGIKTILPDLDLKDGPRNLGSFVAPRMSTWWLLEVREDYRTTDSLTSLID